MTEPALPMTTHTTLSEVIKDWNYWVNKKNLLSLEPQIKLNNSDIAELIGISRQTHSYTYTINEKTETRPIIGTEVVIISSKNV